MTLIDQQHNELNTYLSQIESLVEHRIEDKTILKLIDLIIALLKIHHKTEEDIMNAFDYENKEKHMKAHKVLMHDLNLLKNRVNIDIDTIKFIYSKTVNLKLHEELYDKDLLEYLKKDC